MLENDREPRPADSKVYLLDDLASLVEQWHKAGETVVHCHGVFDLLHPGHIKHLEAAKKQGDRLIVTITSDRHVNKGPGRPIFEEGLRAFTLASIGGVDAVAVNQWQTAVKTINLVKPDIYVKGSDYATPDLDITGKIREEVDALEAIGGRLHVTDEVTFSSSALINRNIDVYPTEIAEWLSGFRKNFQEEQVLNYFDQISEMKVLVLGEAIIDEYIFCEGLGKSSKDPILAFQYLESETYAGGSLAVANHLAGLCNRVSLLTVLGEQDSREGFISKSLHSNIVTNFIYRDDAPTIKKRRYVDTHTKSKLMEIYEMGPETMSPKHEEAVISKLKEIAGDFDIVIVTDYGHGLMTSDIIAKVTQQAKFLAVNAQHNAGNRGFNTISRYLKADYICMNGQELAIETRQRHAPPTELLSQITKNIECDAFTVTLGKYGTLHYGRHDGFSSAPAFAVRVVDRVGSGDAVLAVTAPLVALGAPWDIVGFVSNVIGAQLVGEVGTQFSVSKAGIGNQIKSLMK